MAAGYDERYDPRDGVPTAPERYEYAAPTQPGDDEESTEVFRWSPMVAELYGALAAAQAEIEMADKDRQNNHLGSSYSTLASVREAGRVALAKNGIAVIQGFKTLPGGYVKVSTRLGHKSGEWVECDVTVKSVEAKGLQPLQIIGSVVTYLKRYQLAAMTGTVSGDDDSDDDAQGTGGGRRAEVGAPSGGHFVGALKAFEARAKVTCGEKSVEGALEAFDGVLAEAAKGDDATRRDRMKAAAGLIGIFEAMERKDGDCQRAASEMRKRFAEHTKSAGGGGVAARVAGAKQKLVGDKGDGATCKECGVPIPATGEKRCDACKES